MDVAQRLVFALVQAVHTGYAAAVVYAMILDVNARSFAVACTEVTVGALVGVDDRFQVGIF